MTAPLRIRHNLAQLNQAMVDYQAIGDKTWPEVLAKQGGKLGFAIRRNLQRLSPGKGEVRAEMIDRLTSGEGVRVRPSVWEEVMQKRGARTRLADRRTVFGSGAGKTSVRRKGKRMNLTALAVAREISVRESARGFLGWSARYPRTLKNADKAYSRNRRALSTANIRIGKDEKVVRFEWAGHNETAEIAREGMEQAKADAALDAAIVETTDDIMLYISDRQQKALTQSFSLLNRVSLK